VKALGLVIADGHGSPEFLRQSEEWRAHLAGRGDVVEVVPFAVSTLPIVDRWRAVRAALLAHGSGVEVLAVFCHGWSSGLQLVPGVRVEAFARTLAAVMTGPIVVTLYACTTGSDTDPRTPETAGSDAPGGDGGFADELRDALCAAGRTRCRVDAHTVLGHTSRNPYVRRFDGLGLADGGAGGGWIVRPGGRLWGAWARALAGSLRWDFPTLELDGIRARLVSV